MKHLQIIKRATDTAPDITGDMNHEETVQKQSKHKTVTVGTILDTIAKVHHLNRINTTISKQTTGHRSNATPIIT